MIITQLPTIVIGGRFWIKKITVVVLYRCFVSIVTDIYLRWMEFKHNSITAIMILLVWKSTWIYRLYCVRTQKGLSIPFDICFVVVLVSTTCHQIWACAWNTTEQEGMPCFWCSLWSSWQVTQLESGDECTVSFYIFLISL